MKNNDKNEILEAINTFSTSVDKDFKHVKGDITEMKGDIGYLKTGMVTKDYLDQKMANLRGELVVLTRKEDAKVKTLTKRLHQEKSLSTKSKDKIMAMEPFSEKV